MTPPDAGELAWYPCNDRGNARRLKARAQGLLHWVDMGEMAGYWIGYADGRWNRSTGEMQARLLADEVADCLREEAMALAQQVKDGRLPSGMTEEVAKDRVAEIRSWANKSGNAAQTEGMLKKAKPIMSVSAEMFDRDLYAFNIANGTLRFLQAEDGWQVRLDPHDPADMISRIASVEYDPRAQCSQWLARLDHLQPEPDQREMFRRIMGYALLGVRSEQKWVVAQGRGGDGKGVTVAVLSTIFGDYYRHADVQTFLKGGTKSGSDHSEDLARLGGDTRLVTCDEPERFSMWNSKVLKQWTGGGRMTVRGLRQASTEIEPRGLLLVECNPFPRVPTSDDGFWRRCLPFRWKVQLSEAEQKAGPFDQVRDAMLDERSGILNWMISGALSWLAERDLKPSADALETRENYRNTSDPFAEWYRTRCVTGDPKAPDLREKGSDLHADFKAFCEDELGIDGAKVPGIRAFGTQLDERQHPNRKTMGNKFRLGIRLMRPDELAEREAEDGARMASAGASVSDSAPPDGF